MKSTNRIYAFFMILSLFFWNPLSYYLIYGNTPVITFKEINIFYWFVFIVGVIVIYLILTNRLNIRLKNTVLTLSFTGILFSFLVLINGMLSLSFKDSSSQQNLLIAKQGLIFEPYSNARYQTVEFDYIASINGIGLRDREININKSNKYRILCFGDSWTYGWGVDVENSWPKKLETYFCKLGHYDIEVINCGEPGQYTTTYKRNIAKVVPVLAPDLVIVGVLQYDDLKQLYTHNFKYTNVVTSKSHNSNYYSKRIKLISKSYLKASFGNIIALYKIYKNQASSSDTLMVKSNWEISSKKMIDGFNQVQKFKFQQLPDTLKNLFKSGNLNPRLLQFYVNSYSSTVFNNPAHSATQFSIKEMEKDMKEMKVICKENNCNLIFVNLPMNILTGHKVIRNRTNGDIFNPYLNNNNKIDSIYNSVATSNGLPYIELTDHFLSLEKKDNYFFLYDGHPNENGYEEIANYIGEQLINQNIIQKK